MSAKQEDVMGGMTGGCFPSPQDILGMLAASEQQEVVLYSQIAQAVPSEELRRIILYMACKEQRMAEKLALLSQCFGAMPAGPPVGTMSYSVGEQEEKK
ncbi:MAG: hypothetical protein A4E52_00686 [Pelotomaculum sp. PtaB.Bin013]|uniref:Ferritin-like domain-containing protein n=1 Tax=Pelotomaculum isophthalicicum JI TaxID=947010 RepID=A0A9X4JUC8_9FIRM|nr:ferritin-like domain-containing protein [Pelotomaculum isophthalicicum]MDF9408950.1 ferritin-like domain-containing protein [Pelotomaculum isophthalicicum JI]OPX90872.1 MAG: hypothetical protein A4E52_00686 [Pelotomaculum sp. PtaB.Bin013]